jgi:hypothetical protein
MLFPLWAAKTAHSLCAAGGCGIHMHAAQAACHSPECRCVLFMQRKELLLECTRLQSSCGPDRFEQRSHALIRVSPLRFTVSAVCLHYTEAMPQQLVRLGSLGYRGVCYCGRMCRTSLVITGYRMSTRVLTLRPNCSSAYSSPSSKPSNSLLEFRQDKQNLRQRCSKHNSAKTYPTRYDIQHGMVPHTARYPTRHGIPHGTVSHTARYPTRHPTRHVACCMRAATACRRLYQSPCGIACRRGVVQNKWKPLSQPSHSSIT